MRVAILYSGVIRRYRENYDAFKNAFLYDVGHIVDVYASVNTVDYKSAMEFRQLYNVKQMRIFEFGEEHMPEGYNFVDRNVRWTQMSSASMFYHNKCAFDLLHGSGVTYDIVVKARTDFVNMGRFPYDAITEPGMIYLPDGCSADYANDQVAAGDMVGMERYCGAWNRLVEYVANGIRFHPETILGHHLNKNGYLVKNLDFQYGLDPERHPVGWDDKTR